METVAALLLIMLGAETVHLAATSAHAP